ncbi:MAG: hypothetical protein M1825_005625 [Sarcosagium campestre]|nr:MAG: hypothetical protein M1825_005625 [Sarcosagium campestre]
MSAVEKIPNMRAKALTIMSTREQDQQLVDQVANRFGSEEVSSQGYKGRIVPSFGWHPWFSHQIYDDIEGPKFDGEIENVENAAASSWKRSHYQSVLNPSPSDLDFINALPRPILFSQYIAAVEANLRKHPFALVGEIGLDRSFRLPSAWTDQDTATQDISLTPGGREGRNLSPYRVTPQHQRRIFVEQLRLAGRLQRPVSVHSVQAHGAVFDTLQDTWKGHERKVISNTTRKRRASAAGAHDLEHSDEDSELLEHSHDVASAHGKMSRAARPYPPRICMHSYSGPVEPLKQFLAPSVPTEIFFSFSTAINFSRSNATRATEVIKAVPADRLLIESDLHVAGEEMDDHLAEIALEMCRIKEWDLDVGVQQLATNWHRFVFGKALG